MTVSNGAVQPILVVGAGVSGLCAAIFLGRRGFPVELWEAAERPGGLLAPVEFRGAPCDLGSHRLHGESLPLLRAVTPTLDWQTRPRRGALILRERHIAYPLRLSGFLRGLGLGQAARFGLGFLLRPSSLAKYSSWERDRTRAADRDDDDPGFERFVRERVGDSAYQAFYRPYAEKVWGLPAGEISTTVAKKRVSTARPLEFLRKGLRPAGHRDSAATFEYPRLGMGALVQALLDEATGCGVTIRYGRSFAPADLADDRWRAILYSGHLGELLPEAELGHRGLYLIYLAFPLEKLGSVDTFYAPEGRYWFGRVSVPGNFSPALGALFGAGESALCVEVPEGRWGPAAHFASGPRLDTLLAQLVSARILPPGARPTATHQLFLPAVYPLYRRGWVPRWRAAVRKVAAERRLYPIGRQGLFLHCNIDHCVQIAADAAAHIASSGSAEAWAAQAERYLDLRVRD